MNTSFQGWGSRVDGSFLTDYPENLLKSARNIPVMMGTTSEEFAMMGEWHTRRVLDKVIT